MGTHVRKPGGGRGGIFTVFFLFVFVFVFVFVFFVFFWGGGVGGGGGQERNILRQVRNLNVGEQENFSSKGVISLLM